MKHFRMLVTMIVFILGVGLAVAHAQEEMSADVEIEAEEGLESESTEDVLDLETADTGLAEASDERDIAQQYSFSWEKDEPAYEILGNLMFVMPTDSDWDKATGVELRFRYWLNEQWGWGAGYGYMKWDTSGDDVDIGMDMLYSLEIIGEAKTYPLSVFGCYRHDWHDSLELVADLGLRYLFVDSDAGVFASFREHGAGDVHYGSYVENENLVMGSACIELRGDMTEDLLWLVGAEYAFHMGSPDANWLREDVANDFSGLGLRAGGCWVW